jgi:hypothetical protein
MSEQIDVSVVLILYLDDRIDPVLRIISAGAGFEDRDAAAHRRCQHHE